LPSAPVSDTTHAIAGDGPAEHTTDSTTTIHETTPTTTAPTTVTSVTTASLITTVSTVVPTTTVSGTGPVPGPSSTLVLVTYTTAGLSVPTSAPLSSPSLPAHDADDVNSDSDSEMSTDSLNPPPFRGMTAEDAETWLWLNRFKDYCQWKAYDEHKARALFKVLLRDSARVWLESLDDDTVNSWTNLQQAFNARYMTASFLKYKHASELFNKKQNNETVGDFCAQMQHLANQVNADEQILRFAVLNGLRPDIKDHVTRLQPADWKSLVEAAKIGEMCSPLHSETSTVAMQLALMREQLNNLSTQRSASTAGNRSPPPRRVRFDEQTDDRYDRGYDDRRGEYDDRHGRYDNRNRNERRYDRKRDGRSSPSRYDDRQTSPDRCGDGRQDSSRGSRATGRGQSWRNQNRGDSRSRDRNSRGPGGFRGRSRSSRRGHPQTDY